MSEAFKSPILVTGTLTPSGTQDVNIVSPNPLPVSGTFTPSGTQNVDITGQTITLAISAASLPLPTGASTEATLLAAKTDLDKFTFTSTRLLVDGSGVTQPISGSVSVSNFPATQPISGTITANQGTSPWVVSGTITTSPNVNVHDGSGTSISSTGSSLNVDVTNTVPVTGTFFQATQPVSGTVTANQGTPNTASNKWPIEIVDSAGTNIATVDATGDLQVDVNNFPASQTVNGTVTVVQSTGTNLHTVVDNFPADADALAQGSSTSGQLGALIMAAVTTAAPSYTTATTNPLSLTTAGALRVDGSATTQPISGTITANQGTSPWVISGAVTNTPPSNQSVNLTQLNSVALGSPSNYGTSPGTVEVLGVNAFITNTPAVTLASTTITGTVAVTQSTSPWVVSLASTTLTGTSTVAGNLTNNNAAPIGNNLGVLPALANAANPSWTEGDQVLLSEDLSGNLRVKVNSPLPAGTNVIGHVITDTGSTTAVTGNVTVVQPTGANLNVAVSNFPADTDAVAIGSTTAGQLGSLSMGAVTTAAPTYVTAQTNPLSLDTAGNLRVLTGAGSTTVVTGNVTVVQPTGTNLHTVVDNFPADADALAQGSTTSGQLGALVMGAVTTSPPTYVTAQTSPLSLTTTGALRVINAGTPTSTVTRIASSTTNQTLAASNTARKGLILYNDGTANQFVKFGATATITSFTVKLGANAYYELPDVNIYNGIVDCISSSTNGAIQVTEIS